MKFYNVIMCHLSVISLFSCFTGVVASQVLQNPKSPELLCIGRPQEQQVASEKNNQSAEDLGKNGMLGEAYAKSLEAFRKNKVAMQQKRELKRLEKEHLAAERKRKIDALNF